MHKSTKRRGCDPDAHNEALMAAILDVLEQSSAATMSQYEIACEIRDATLLVNGRPEFTHRTR